ncbi:hypothetical protein CANCADRAFT_31275 [Tortispora caseinolytica NRRL Y-17796]|uniref:Tr-type G domain-containing protein n=1 Tax=Tortispora caseinolytica NRRL Y-17796 TaxID=767744 RepID=A0A1E4TER5_9ASCO|nr:hypothetical protein CANCADRAFT_31275 [Tortispora caseinolytica NRRL Y-17796]
MNCRGYAKRIDPTKPDPELITQIESIPIDRYRNFSIVAHVDHGKSTLSDRLLQLTGTIPINSDKQFLDRLEVERERGITIKAQTCTMIYNHKGEDYLLNLVDTPGHVDFRAEVSRSYASCRGALLIVDASQGVQAQTVANFYMAYAQDLKLIPVVNKIDLPHADIDRVLDQIEEMFELDRNDAIAISAKTGHNIEQILPAIIDRIPPPAGLKTDPLRCLLVDSWFDPYMGVILLVYVADGSLKKGDKVTSAFTRRRYDIKEAGIMHPDRTPTDALVAGQVGYISLGMKDSSEAHVGDTIMHITDIDKIEPLPGFEESKPMVFVGAYPAEGTDFKKMEESIERLVLNDRSVTMQKETSIALGQGWRLGFLGTLHASVFQERLSKEYGTSLLITKPTVPYKVLYKDGTEVIIDRPDKFPDLAVQKTKVKQLLEPMVDTMMTFPQEYIGNVISLCENGRGTQLESTYLNTGQVFLRYRMPLASLVNDFFGKLKGMTKGYASLDYEESGYDEAELQKLDLLVNGVAVDALSAVMHKSEVQAAGKEWTSKFKEFLGHELFEVIIQAAVGTKIVSRERIRAKRKDVLHKLHASDLSRRKKLLEKQKAGKKAMKEIGRVQIPHEAFEGFLANR